MIRFFCLVGLLISSCIYGSGALTVPERLFRISGAEVNVTEGDLLYKSQAAGYYTGGGGMVLRSPIKSTYPLNIQLPKIEAGCGGIDIYTGGFSFIDSKQLVETLQAIASNAAGYAFLLGLESVSPTITNSVRQLQSWANQINGIGINSCETAARLVGSVWPAQDMARQHVCRTFGKTTFRDYNDARQKCSSTAGAKQVNNELPYEGEYNIAWEALMTQPFFKNHANKELAEMYMTLVGTFIFKENERHKIFLFKSRKQ